MPNNFLRGIDVSSNQGAVDWAKVAEDGVSFAFARATIGGHQTDSKFADNWPGMLNAGLIRGAYHFFWPLTPWQEQADNLITTIGSLQHGDLPPALDLEEAVLNADPQHDTWEDIPFDQRLPIIQNWIHAVNQALHIKPVVYTRQNFIENLLGNGVEQLSGSLLWVSHYNVSRPKIPSAWDTWTWWQFTETDKVSGINGNVDGDKFQGSVEELRSFTKV